MHKQWNLLFLGLLIEWLGGMLGFAAGPGSSGENVVKYEFRRFGDDEPAVSNRG